MPPHATPRHVTDYRRSLIIGCTVWRIHLADWRTAARSGVLIDTQVGIGPHDDVITWKHFSRNWPFVRGIHRSSVNFLHKGQWCGALMFSLICAWINGWVNNGEVGDLRRHRTHYDATVMYMVRYSITETEMSFCRRYYHDLHWDLSFWQLQLPSSSTFREICETIASVT